MYILKYIDKNFKLQSKIPFVIFNGTKITFLTYEGIRFVDSLSFLPMSLESFSKTFSIPELKKGYFPHLFNKVENFNYNSTWPDKEFYGSEYFSSTKKCEFDVWYEENKHKTFNFQKELNDYCLSDVELLQAGCLKFREIIRDIAGIDAFAEVITLASLTSLIYRKLNMEESSIGIIPDKGYNANLKQSKSAILWMSYLMHCDKNINIINKANGCVEVKVGSYNIDGFCKETNTYYEFHGCYWHGCPKCHPPESYNTTTQSTWGRVHEKHLKRINEIKKLIKIQHKDSKLIEMWECEFNSDKQKKESLKQFMLQTEYVEPINPRDALYGGRTNSLKLYHKVTGTEKIKYVDFCSLYPYVMSMRAYPIGHPEIITENFKELDEYFGIIKCSILPPQNIFHPVLPKKINKKLLFTLCDTCAKNEQSTCDHDTKNRMLTGTWVTEEVKEAVAEGYVIQKIHEVWHYPNRSEYNKETKTGGLFTKQIQLLLKYKQEASGQPVDEDVDEFIKKFETIEGKYTFNYYFL